VVSKLGLQQFGKEGEPFDPTLHEALMHSYSSDVTEDTCVQIPQPGYRIGERIIRPAMVAVAEPQPGTQSTAAPDTDSDADGPAKADGGSEN
jgi:molecular chaperone GrpE